MWHARGWAFAVVESHALMKRGEGNADIAQGIGPAGQEADREAGESMRIGGIVYAPHLSGDGVIGGGGLRAREWPLKDDWS